jgi:tetratricopeptide (TPR) repeat protein
MRHLPCSAITFLICLFLWNTGCAQSDTKTPQKETNRKKSSDYKSFKSRISQEGPAESLATANAIKATDPSAALELVKKALGLSIAAGDPFNEAKCYILLGAINEQIQEWKLADDNYTMANEKLRDDYSKSPEYVDALLGLGRTNLSLGNYEKSLTSYQEALSLSSEPAINLQLSEVHYQMGQYREALQDLEAPAKVSVRNRSLDSRIENQKVKIYARMNDLDKTTNFYSNSLNAVRSSGRLDKEEEKSLQSTKEEVVDVLRLQNRADDEIKLRNQSIEYNLESKNMVEVAKDKVEISKTLDAAGKTSAAIKELEGAVSIADTLNDPQEQAAAYLALAELYEKNGRSREAISLYQKFSRAIVRKDETQQTKLLEKANLIKQQRDIEEVSKYISLGQQQDKIDQATLFRQQLIIYGLLLVIGIIAATSYFIYRNAQASKRANRLLALKSLRGQMNPHFIFNALNSVNHFIAEEDERKANLYLSDFSQLMRLVLENSQEDFISLETEKEILLLYLKLEHYRFRDKFDYSFIMDPNIEADTITIPPMLIQPYLENAVWHGLRYKTTPGNLNVNFAKEEKGITVEISDDGIGRKKSSELKTSNQKKHNSTGLKNIRERIDIINKVYKIDYKVSVNDGKDGTGTVVTIFIPENTAH